MVHLGRGRMFALPTKLMVLTAVGAMLVFPVGASGADGKANAATYKRVVASPGAGVSRATQLATIRYWTPERMRSAKQMRLPKVRLGARAEFGTSTDAIGRAGSVNGVQPKNARAADSLGSRVQPTGYSYPYPFTRYFIPVAFYPGYYPYISVGKLFFTQNGGNYVCSAASVASPAATQAVWTAGHCLNDGSQTWSTNVAFVPSYKNGVAPYGVFPGIGSWTTWPWHLNGDLTRDLGAFRVGTNAAGQTLQSRVGSLGFAWNWAREQHWNDFGYPQAAPFTGQWLVVCQASHAVNDTGIAGVGPDPIGIGCDMTGGSSGGPFILRFGSGNYINGHNDYKYINPAMPLAMFTPYFDTLANQVRCAAAAIAGC